MNRKRSATFAILIALLVCSACNLQFAEPGRGNPIGTAVAQTNLAKQAAATLTALAAGVSASTPSDTPLPTLTFTPAMVTVSVSVATNCRTGPGKAYDLVGALGVGKTAQVVGRAADGQYWLILNPSNPSTVCWLWGYYATLTGDTAGLPVATPPPTPTPAPGFTFSYYFWGIGPGYQCFRFNVSNTGSVTWESFMLTLYNGAHGTTASSSSDEFIGYDNWCNSTGSQVDLMPGETGTASVKTFLAYNPAGENFDATLKLCSENGLGGTCLSQTINFTP